MLIKKARAFLIIDTILLVDGEYKDDNSSFGTRTLEFLLEAMLIGLVYNDLYAT